MIEPQTNEGYVFGEASRLASSLDVASTSEPIRHFLSDSGGFEIVVMVVVVLYIIWIARSLANLADVPFRISNPFAQITGSTGLGATVKVGDVVLEWMLVSSIFMLFATKAVDTLYPYSLTLDSLSAQITELGVVWWMLIVVGGFWLTMLWSIILLLVVGFFFRSNWLLPQTTLIKSSLLSMSVVWLLPVLIFSSMEQEVLFMTFLAIILSITFVAIYLFRIFSLFRSENFSILHCILYLCSVELFPITFLWVYFVR
ncbi:MAG: DUF4271 domain-containing protein [Rikenellaceae bacterium]